jgi:hypothetical protein
MIKTGYLQTPNILQSGLIFINVGLLSTVGNADHIF